MSLDEEGRRARARVAINSRWHRDRPELFADDLRSLRFKAAQRYIADLTGSLPALTVEERARLARLLLPGGDA